MRFSRPRRAWFWYVAIALAIGLPAAVRATDRQEIDLSGAGWRLWLDRAAAWQHDKLFFPAPPAADLPVNPPTGGWEALAGAEPRAVAVPGTVEEYLQTTPGPAGDLTGVSWWCRTFDVPKADGPRKILLRFESVRLRAEVYVNRRLVGYDVVGNTPFEVDLSSAVQPGERCELAVRVTDPGGNFDWRDSQPLRWGDYVLPLSHGFGGITGRVRLVVCEPVYLDDVFVENTPAITTANALLTVRNGAGEPQRRGLAVRVFERQNPTHEIFREELAARTFPPGDTTVTVKIDAPDARRWQLDDPQLYMCEATLLDDGGERDGERRTFGFRWFAPEDVGTNAVLRLNDRRIVLRTAISWGFWPVNGIFPTPELAEKQVRTAKALGLNMLNFHRAIGNPLVLEQADELGLLYFEEPGAYKSVGADAFGQRLAREKLLRMVHRDRSHPSLVIYNLINEWDSRNPHPNLREIDRHRDDMAAAHALDPSRLILHTSAWARGVDIDDPAKLHFRAFETEPRWNGWYDVHHAGGPAVWNEALYRNPHDFYGRTENRREIVFWGEEGAISSPPRLELIERELAAAPREGWDGGGYRDWFRAFEAFIRRKDLGGAFPTVDALTSAMGTVSLYHQGRRIENMRLSDVADGYAINGWESELIENHSGIVDCFRNPKGDPAILAYYNQPLYVAVKVRTTVVQPPAEVVVDIFSINEKNLRGRHRLRMMLRDAAGRVVTESSREVTLTGGEVYGELLAENVKLPLPAGTLGRCTVEAVLADADGVERARGRDELWATDWRGDAVTGAGAVWESGAAVRDFLQREKACDAPVFARALPRLDWIVAARAPGEGEPTVVPAEALEKSGTGEAAGWRTTIFSDRKFEHEVHQRSDATISLAVDDGAAPDPALSVMRDFGVRWEARIVPPRTGRYGFVIRANGRAQLSVGGKTVIPFQPRNAPPNPRGEVELRADEPVEVRLEFVAAGGAAQCELGWVTPDRDPGLADELLERVRRDGTTLIVLERADAWMARLATEPGSPIKYSGAFRVGKTWLGGLHFVREHALFRGLPVNTAMDWPYQSVVRNGEERMGLLLEGEELAAGCYHSFPMQLGTVAGTFPLGRGRVIFSTLDIVANLAAPAGPADVARKLLGNFIECASARPR